MPTHTVCSNHSPVTCHSLKLNSRNYRFAVILSCGNSWIRPIGLLRLANLDKTHRVDYIRQMPVLSIVLGPDPIFRRKATPVPIMNDAVRQHLHAMLETLYREGAVGLGANMVGLTERLVVVDLCEGGVRQPYLMANPEIIAKSAEMQTTDESSLSFPGITVAVPRPKAITVQYLDVHGAIQTLEATGYLATVIQHEMEYLEGRTFLDHLSNLKRETLIKRMLKDRKRHTHHHHGHVHGPGCQH